MECVTAEKTVYKNVPSVLDLSTHRKGGLTRSDKLGSKKSFTSANLAVVTEYFPSLSTFFHRANARACSYKEDNQDTVACFQGSPARLGGDHHAELRSTPLHRVVFLYPPNTDTALEVSRLEYVLEEHFRAFSGRHGDCGPRRDT